MSTETAQEEDQEETVECEECGTTLRIDHDSIDSTDKHENLCRECFHEYVDTCQLCGDAEVYPSAVSKFIVVKTELARENMPPGIYMVLTRPFLLIPLIGGGSITDYAVLFIDKLPKTDRHFEISGHICAECAKPYEATFHAAYGGLSAEAIDKRVFAKSKPQVPGKYDLESARMREVILANPDMLRDLDEGPKYRYRWDTIRKRCGLTDDMPTYHEYIFVEHKGVRIYYSWVPEPEPYRAAYGVGWLTWQPYNRSNGHRDCFCPSGLPTYVPSGKDSYYDYERTERERAACIAAIDAGILTQNGPTIPCY